MVETNEDSFVHARTARDHYHRVLVEDGYRRFLRLIKDCADLRRRGAFKPTTIPAAA